MTRKLLLVIWGVCLLAACSHTSPGPNSATSPHIASPAVSAAAASPAAAAPPAATLGCGTYCQQAGASQGGPSHGYPCSKAGCLQCPPHNCVTLESSGATVTNGMATVKLRCNLPTACHGALLICLPTTVCSSGPTIDAELGGRLAAADFVIPPKTTREVTVVVTTLGKQVASGPGGFHASVVADLLDYGFLPWPLVPGYFSVVPPSNLSATDNFRFTSAGPPVFPTGATASCGGIIFVGPGTSCPFAKNVYKAFLRSYRSTGSTVRAFSPVTGKTYVMRCTGGSPHVCRGGTNALVEFYH